MPTDTFHRLKQEKKDAFIHASLLEFAHNNYESASINRVIKTLGIARGSVYQYFTDKLDLWLFLKEYSEEIKMQYIVKIDRNSFESFWEYFKALYISGIDFDLEHPISSLFLYRIGFQEHAKEVKPYLDGWKAKAKKYMETLVEHEKEMGTFNNEFSIGIMVHFMLTMSLSIADLMKNNFNVDFDQNIQKGKPLFGSNKKELVAAVDELINMMKKALQP